MIDISVNDIYTFGRPLYDAVYPYVIIVAVLPFAFWIGSKINQFREGKESLFGIISKALVFLFFLFFWQPFFIATYYLNDALEARIHEINLAPVLSSIGYTENDSQILDVILLDFRGELPKVLKENEELNNAAQSLNWRAAEIKNVSKLDILKSKITNVLQNIKEKSAEVTDKMASTVGSAGIGLVQAPIVGIVYFLATIVKALAMLIRIICSFFYYIAIPFLFICSYLPILGDQSDLNGLNSFSKKTINWFISMAMWPTLFALVDKILVIVYFTLRYNGMFEGVNSITYYVAFLLAFIITYIALPFTVARANPYGIMQGTLSAISTTGIMTAIMSSSSIKSIGAVLQQSRVKSSISNIQSEPTNNISGGGNS